MPPKTFPREPGHLRRRQVRLLLKGGTEVEGLIHIPEGQPLLHFLGLRKHFLNLTSVSIHPGAPETEPLEHLSVRLSNVVWVIPVDATLHLSAAAALLGSGRTVELQLVDGLNLTVVLNLAAEQRMSDYLDSNVQFLPLWDAEIASRDFHIERIAVNHEAILAIREVMEPDG